MTTGTLCANAHSGCRGLANPAQPECTQCQRQRKIASLRESPTLGTHLLAWLIQHAPHRDLELDADREAGG